MDIRKFFSPIGKTSTTKDTADSRKRKKKIIDSDDDEDPLPSKGKKQATRIAVSDSDDDIFILTPKRENKMVSSNEKPINKRNGNASSSKKTGGGSKQKPTMKMTSAKDFFGSAPVTQAKLSTKRKTENHEDADFEETLKQLDVASSCKPKKLKKEEGTLKPNEGSTSHKHEHRKGVAVSLSLKQDPKRDTEDSSPHKHEHRKGVASILSQKQEPKKDTKESPHHKQEHSKGIEGSLSHKQDPKRETEDSSPHKHEQKKGVACTLLHKQEPKKGTEDSPHHKQEHSKGIEGSLSHKQDPKRETEDSSPHKHDQKKGVASTLLHKQEPKKGTEDSPHHKQEHSKGIEGSLSQKQEPKKGLAAKLASKLKANEEKAEIKESGERGKMSASRHLPFDDSRPHKQKTPTKETLKDESSYAKTLVSPRKKSETLVSQSKESKSLVSPSKNLETNLSARGASKSLVSPKEESKKPGSPRMTGKTASSQKKTPQMTPTSRYRNKSKNIEFVKHEKDEDKKDKDSVPSTPEIDEKKKQQSVAYRKYLQREGPKNPGAKPLPEGKPNCLRGRTFVLTGVLETIDRDETAELIKNYGGKVTTSVSRNTSYVVVGDGAGESKLKKAEQLGTKQLNEDKLFDLISKSLEADSTSNDNVKTPQALERNVSSSMLDSKFHRSPGTKAFNFNSEPSSSSEHRSCEGSGSSVSSQDSASLLSESFSSPSSKGFSSPLSQKVERFSSSSTLLAESSSQKETGASVPDSAMWVDKYKPTTTKSIIGQHGELSNAKKLIRWLSSWLSNHTGNKKLVKPNPWAKDYSGACFKAALLSGSPGIGKTTTAHLACKELGFDVVEMNASDTRSKKLLENEVSELLTNKSLSGFVSGCSKESMSRKHVLLMDEVDGMAGNEDRGGVQELIALIKSSRIPIICMCNDRNHPKIRSLANHCFDLRFQKPRIEQIRGAMLSVCFKEGIKIKPEALDQIIVGSNHDVRQVLHHLSMWSADQKDLESETVKKDVNMSKKDFKLGPWDVVQKVFSESAQKDMNIHDKVSLFFHDYSIGPLFVQENYLKVLPHAARGNQKSIMQQVAKTATVLSDADLIEKAVRSESAWSLLPTQALLSSVLPGAYMAGHFSAQVEFPKWLGNNSRRNKFDRISQELYTHMRLRISGSKQDIVSDYGSRIRDAVIQPLVKNGAYGVYDAVSAMTSNDLIREDLESLMELCSWPGIKDKMANVDSKVKAAFTRALNKDPHMNPFSTASAVTKKKLKKADDLQYPEDGEEEDEDEQEEEEDITKNAMIKPGKTSAASTKKGIKADTSSSSSSKSKGGKTKGSRK